MQLKNILVVYSKPTNKMQKSTLEIVKNTLKKYKKNYKISVRENLNKKLFKNKNLIIAVGGDGTFLRASHFIFNKTPILGVNSDPKHKEGFFMDAEGKDFEEKFKRILEGNYTIRKLNRLEAYIGKKRVQELALNEFYISSEKEYRTARYYLTVRGKRERQKSSGIIISTSAGSYAWMKSAGGKQLPLDSDRFEYIVREPYSCRITPKCKLVNGILSKKEKIMVEFEFSNGTLIADSLSKEYRFKAGQKVTIGVSKNPVSSLFDKII